MVNGFFLLFFCPFFLHLHLMKDTYSCEMLANKTRGVLCSQHIARLIEDKHIEATDVSDGIRIEQIQPNTLDLRIGLGTVAISGMSFLPHGKGVEETVVALGIARQEKLGQFLLVPGQVLTVPLAERLSLPAGVRGRCNPKSTAGRLGLFVRVIAEGGAAYDQIPDGYEGPLWAQISTICFPVILQVGDCLTQIRFFLGDTRLSPDEVDLLIRSYGRLVRHDAPVTPAADEVSKALSLVGLASHGASSPSPNDLRFSANLEGVGRVAFSNSPWASTPIVYAQKGRFAPERYWVSRRADRGGIIAHPSVLHLLASREYITIPPEVCGEMIAIQEGAGEFRAHFAGFFDSGFGFGSPSKIVMEIVPYGTPVFLHHGQALFRFELHKNLDRPAFLYGMGPAGNSYQGQDLRLAKQFLPWPDRGR